MALPAKLEVTVKFNQLPMEVTKDQNGWSFFTLDCGPGLQVKLHLRPKMFIKLEQAQKDWPQWVASVTGRVSAMDAQGFTLLEPGLQVFEKKAKESVVHKMEAASIITSGSES